MKGLRKYISPFSPDQSGAASVLFGYGGMLIIMDAGGCVGNVCGYDEPRWGGAKSAIFSASSLAKTDGSIHKSIFHFIFLLNT